MSGFLYGKSLTFFIKRRDVQVSSNVLIVVNLLEIAEVIWCGFVFIFIDEFLSSGIQNPNCCLILSLYLFSYIVTNWITMCNETKEMNMKQEIANTGRPIFWAELAEILMNKIR